MRKSVLCFVSFVFLLSLAFGISSTSAASLNGTFTTGTDNGGSNYGFLAFSSVQNVTSVTTTFAAGTTSAKVECDVPSLNPHHGLGNPNDASEWQPVWGISNPTGTVTVGAKCTTQWVRVNVSTGPFPTSISANGSVVATQTATTTKVATSTLVATNTSVPTATSSVSPTNTPSATATLSPTNTPSPTATLAPTNTPSPTATTVSGNNGTPASDCRDLGDGAVDQNGISVDVWAPGLRKACGFLGYENGDNPMPPGTLMPPPRPFRFDYIVDHNEPVFGFKVYYRTGSEAPAGYGGTNGCGDIRVILHQGGSVGGFTTQFHTYQYTEVQCDAQGNPHIIDIAGQINTGVLDLRSHPDSERSQVDRLTADTISCDQKTSFICATVWYSAYEFQLPGAPYNGWEHMGFLVENPISLYNNANPTVYAPGPGDGTTTMVRDVQRDMPPHNQSDWWVMFNESTGVNEIVPAGTVGAWQNHVDTYFSDYQVLEPASGTDHPHSVSGIVYPN